MCERILISGAASGIGSAIAKSLAERYSLVLHGRNIPALESLKSLLPNSDFHSILSCDFAGTFADLETKIATEISERGEISGFIHCAGTDFYAPARLANSEQIEELFRINVFSAILIVSALLKKRVNGSALKNILFISSVSSVRGCAGKSFYASSKGALNSYARTLARELAPTVRVNTLLCGAVRTAMTEQVFQNPEFAEKTKRVHPLGIGVPADVVGAVEFLFSDSARWVTGVEIPIDGGFCI